MRVTSEFFVSALIRRVFSSGGFAAVERKGAAEAGAIFIRTRARDGFETLYGPAPQSVFDEENSGDRRFEIRVRHGDGSAVEAVILREAKFDPDLWLVELETESVEGLLTVDDDQGH
ncbi:hypothetical protein M2360_004011 [Rhizobium sp. SG_E_25_P2]|uniref:DUF1491 family protein n=1 Tax=Rhizobium sp. SG_E_25_P2 TaxID=2879942 RepID=UPI0024757A6F|nr:DUF1491 family protein [Rhizobium sp. SG_E_25_P2]MDH6268604.1 hypothetical protein [Rhizobium sp. SG_E_25_P2]